MLFERMIKTARAVTVTFVIIIGMLEFLVVIMGIGQFVSLVNNLYYLFVFFLVTVVGAVSLLRYRKRLNPQPIVVRWRKD